MGSLIRKFSELGASRSYFNIHTRPPDAINLPSRHKASMTQVNFNLPEPTHVKEKSSPGL